MMARNLSTALSWKWNADPSGGGGGSGGSGGTGGSGGGTGGWQAYGGYSGPGGSGVGQGGGGGGQTGGGGGSTGGGGGQTSPEETGGSFSPAPVSGNLSAADPDNGDSLTYSASQPSSGSLQLNSSTGAYTYTPASGDSNTVVITFTASDGIKTSNVASLFIDGYEIKTDTQTGGTYVQYDSFPWAGANIGYIWGGEYDMVQGGKLQVDAPGVLSDAYPADQNSGNPSVSSIIEQPQHGSLSMTNSTGAFTYTPNPYYSGLDWFTWQVKDDSGSGPYASAFIYVAPLNPTISVGSLKEGDPTAQIPNSQFPPDANGDPQYATINLNPGASLPNGSTVTLSVNSDVENDLNIYDGVPGQSGSNLIIGKDAGTDTYTWTVSATQGVPSQVYAVGLAGTNYDQITFTLSVSVGTTEYGNSGGNSPDASPAAQPTTKQANTPASAPAKHDYVVALDGTLDNAAAHTNIFRFAQQFTKEFRGYVEGVANPDTDPKLGKVKNFPFGGPEMQHFVQEAETDVNTFYTEDKTHQDDVLDVVGYSRGAIEAVQVINDLLTSGLPDVGKKDVTRDGHVADPNGPWKPIVRFVGLISPYHGPKDAPRNGQWPTNLPASVGPVFIASAKIPIAVGVAGGVMINEKIITKGPNLQPIQVTPYKLSHTEAGHKQIVLDGLMAAARDAKVIFKS